jgi:hypothetical protein
VIFFDHAIPLKPISGDLRNLRRVPENVPERERFGAPSEHRFVHRLSVENIADDAFAADRQLVELIVSAARSDATFGDGVAQKFSVFRVRVEIRFQIIDFRQKNAVTRIGAQRLTY